MFAFTPSLIVFSLVFPLRSYVESAGNKYAASKQGCEGLKPGYNISINPLINNEYLVINTNLC